MNTIRNFHIHITFWPALCTYVPCLYAVFYGFCKPKGSLRKIDLNSELRWRRSLTIQHDPSRCLTETQIGWIQSSTWTGDVGPSVGEQGSLRNNVGNDGHAHQPHI
jgi:hypothetical protein